MYVFKERELILPQGRPAGHAGRNIFAMQGHGVHWEERNRNKYVFPHPAEEASSSYLYIVEFSFYNRGVAAFLLRGMLK